MVSKMLLFMFGMVVYASASTTTPYESGDESEFEPIPAKRFRSERTPALLSMDSSPWYGDSDRICTHVLDGVRRQDWNSEADTRPFVRGSVWREDVCPPLGGILRIKQELQCGDYGRIFSGSVGNQSVVVKYSSDSHLRAPDVETHSLDHPLVTEYMFLSLLNKTGVAPSVFYISPPAVLPREGFNTTRFVGRFLADYMAESIELGAQVRFLVMEKVNGASWDTVVEYTNKDLSVNSTKLLLSATRTLIDVLELIHEVGVVHGDIHGGNIMFRTQEGEDNFVQVLLIDFEYAVLMANSFGAPVGDLPVGLFNLDFLSPWQLGGFRKGPRDDIFRTIELLARALARGKMEERMERVRRINSDLIRNTSARREANIRDMELIKTIEPMFQRSAIIGNEVEIRVQTLVLQMLENIATHVRTAYSHHPDAAINYKHIKTSIDDILALL
jgi:serine/threonine protein kinase